ncbi:hypothetical protein [Halalkalicoccus salilacus]|uniref:hypothetical protein n=1 Tax=Halalkalicoccus TaxID=332246 RepID=UPI002F96B501
MRNLKDFRDVRSPEDLSRHQRLLVLYAIGLVSVILFYTLVYNTGMRTLEGESHSLFRSFQTVVETMTTTGYGADSPWSTPWIITSVGMDVNLELGVIFRDSTVSEFRTLIESLRMSEYFHQITAQRVDSGWHFYRTANGTK